MEQMPEEERFNADKLEDINPLETGSSKLRVTTLLVLQAQSKKVQTTTS